MAMALVPVSVTLFFVFGLGHAQTQQALNGSIFVKLFHHRS